MVNLPPQFKKIYKYTSMSACQSILKNQSIRFKNPSDFNDVFDCDLEGIYFDHTKSDQACKDDIAILTKAVPSLKQNMHLLNEGYKYSINKKLSNSGFTCFSLLENHQLMWAHYAESHKGVCIEFENVDQPFEDVKIHISGKMNYGNFGSVNYCENKVLGLARVFLAKHSDWKYENEFRLGTLSGPGDYRFRNSFIKRIIFGLRCESEQIKIVESLCKEKHFNITFQQAFKQGNFIKYSKI